MSTTNRTNKQLGGPKKLGGRVTRPSAEDDHSTRALQAFNQRIFSDPRLQTAILPVGDGLAVALRLPDP